MFPSVFPNDSNSSGERKVFELFKEKAPDDWFILHSYRLKSHQKVLFGEADFIVIAPCFGLFVLEVKSGGIGFDGTYWHFINRFGEETLKQRGPFAQAYDAMFEIRKTLRNFFGDRFSSSNLLIGYGVIFTDTNDFPLDALTEDHKWRLYQDTEKRDYVGFIKTLTVQFRKELHELGMNQPKELSSEDAKTIAAKMRPIVDCVIPLKSFIEQSEGELLKLTEEQYSCIDDIEINRRIVIEGGAGTGKTLIAVEHARRISQEGKKVLFLCYSRKLASYIADNLWDKNIDTTSIHALMTKIAHKYNLNLHKYDHNESFFDEVLPTAILPFLKNENKYESIIVDEFQDICTKQYLDVINSLLIGGLRDGRFVFFGDFSHQAIFNCNSSIKNLSKYSFFARKKLSINCRNTKNIGNELVNISGFSDTAYRFVVEGAVVDYYVWDSIETQKQLLRSSLSKLRKMGISGESIMILSPFRRENSIVFSIDSDKYIIGNNGDDPSGYYALFDTIQAFKGLENQVVILVDIDSYDNKKLMYVAFSRAKSKMIVLESSKASEQRLRLLTER